MFFSRKLCPNLLWSHVLGPVRFFFHALFQARILEQVATPSPGDLLNPVIGPASPILASGFFTPEPQVQFSSVQLLSRFWLFAIPWTTACQASLSITNSWSPPKPMSIEPMMPYNHLILCCPLFLLPSIFPSIRVIFSESALRIRWPKYWSFSFNISPSNEHPGLISFRMDWLDFLAAQGTLKSFLQNHSFLVLSFLYSPTLTSIPDHWKNHSLD